jgi:UDPglucose--hexose-1-phosphate uridylyltransferase
MAKAEIDKEFEIKAFPDVSAGIVKWPMSVIRVSSENRKSLSECCAHILEKWREYSDADVGIFAETDGIPHNTVTPIARMNGNRYECDLVLRNNLTSEERPLGIFHPNPSLHHIKKENIGLIEVMGLAVLPARLAKEIPLMEKALLDGKPLSSDSELGAHAEWLNGILKEYKEITEENAKRIVEKEIGKVFLNVLEDAGVFKRDEAGMNAFLRFVDFIA